MKNIYSGLNYDEQQEIREEFQEQIMSTRDLKEVIVLKKKLMELDKQVLLEDIEDARKKIAERQENLKELLVELNEIEYALGEEK